MPRLEREGCDPTRGRGPLKKNRISSVAKSGGEEISKRVGNPGKPMQKADAIITH